MHIGAHLQFIDPAVKSNPVQVCGFGCCQVGLVIYNVSSVLSDVRMHLTKEIVYG